MTVARSAVAAAGTACSTLLGAFCSRPWPRPRRTRICSSSPASPATRSTSAQFHKWAIGGRRRREEASASPTRTSRISASKPEQDPRASRRARRRRTSPRRSPTSPRAPSRPTRCSCCSSATAASTARIGAFNLPGPDLTAADYAKLLDRLTAQRIVFVNTASSSGAFVQPLAGPGRTIVTATKTGGERNETRFPELFRRGLRRTRRPTAIATAASRSLEAFDYARTKVKARVRAGRPHPDRARDARRRERGQVRGDAVPRAARVAGSRGRHGGSDAPRAARGAGRARAAGRRAPAAEGLDGAGAVRAGARRSC